eukprot:TRINITY_DN36279_c0_g1_i1.p1 TRINITY_DN36279_c0_g1~~TRINITY_DN36279_c0_g1_i1.p1  ORF type:complete len:427 (+),score=153.89 TRINITY_DN36279_c0_g1_i1:58-1338(+)
MEPPDGVIGCDASCFVAESAAEAAVRYLAEHTTRCEQAHSDCTAAAQALRPSFPQLHTAKTLRRQRDGEAADLTAAVQKLRAEVAESLCVAAEQAAANDGLRTQAEASRKKIADLSRMAAPLQQRVQYRKGVAPAVVLERQPAAPIVPRADEESMALLRHCGSFPGAPDSVRVSLPTDRADALSVEAVRKTNELAELISRREEQHRAFDAALARAKAAEDAAHATAAAKLSTVEKAARQAWALAVATADELCGRYAASLREERVLWQREAQLQHQLSSCEAQLAVERKRRAAAMAEAIAAAERRLDEEEGSLRRETRRCDSERAALAKKRKAADEVHKKYLRKARERVALTRKQAAREAKARMLDVAGYAEEIKVMTRELAAVERKVARTRRVADREHPVAASQTSPPRRRASPVRRVRIVEHASG